MLAEVAARRSVPLTLARSGENSISFPNAISVHASTLQSLNIFDEAELLFREALAIGAATIGTAHPDYATDLNNLGVNSYYQEKYAEARDYYEQTLSIRKASLPADHPNIAQSERSLAAVIAALP